MVSVVVEVNVCLVVGNPVPYVVLYTDEVVLDVPTIVPAPESVKNWVSVLLLVLALVTPNGIVAYVVLNAVSVCLPPG